MKLNIAADHCTSFKGKYKQINAFAIQKTAETLSSKKLWEPQLANSFPCKFRRGEVLFDDVGQFFQSLICVEQDYTIVIITENYFF